MANNVNNSNNFVLNCTFYKGSFSPVGLSGLETLLAFNGTPSTDHGDFIAATMDADKYRWIMKHVATNINPDILSMLTSDAAPVNEPAPVNEDKPKKVRTPRPAVELPADVDKDDKAAVRRAKRKARLDAMTEEELAQYKQHKAELRAARRARKNGKPVPEVTTPAPVVNKPADKPAKKVETPAVETPAPKNDKPAAPAKVKKNDVLKDLLPLVAKRYDLKPAAIKMNVAKATYTLETIINNEGNLELVMVNGDTTKTYDADLLIVSTATLVEIRDYIKAHLVTAKPANEEAVKPTAKKPAHPVLNGLTGEKLDTIDAIITKCKLGKAMAKTINLDEPVRISDKVSVVRLVMSQTSLTIVCSNNEGKEKPINARNVELANLKTILSAM